MGRSLHGLGVLSGLLDVQLVHLCAEVLEVGERGAEAAHGVG